MTDGTSNKTSPGMNRTGIATSPRMTPEMVRAADSLSPAADGNGAELARVRALYVAHSTRFGSMPPPASLKEAANDALQLLKGNKPLVLLDKLANRLAFERTGTRLYDQLLARAVGGQTWDGGPTVEEIAAIRDDELQHFALVHRWITRLGGDPTVISPSAEVSAVAALGPLQVLGDSRISLRYALDAILIAELTDNDGWALLIDLAEDAGLHDMASDFRRAFAVEEEHLLRVRTWIRNATLSEARMDLEDEPGVETDSLQQLPLH